MIFSSPYENTVIFWPYVKCTSPTASPVDMLPKAAILCIVKQYKSRTMFYSTLQISKNSAAKQPILSHVSCNQKWMLQIAAKLQTLLQKCPGLVLCLYVWEGDTILSIISSTMDNLLTILCMCIQELTQLNSMGHSPRKVQNCYLGFLLLIIVKINYVVWFLETRTKVRTKVCDTQLT